MAIEIVKSGNHYMTKATACPVCEKQLGEYETMGRHIVASDECREKLAGERQ